MSTFTDGATVAGTQTPEAVIDTATVQYKDVLDSQRIYDSSTTLLSDSDITLFQWIMFTGLGIFINVFGMVSNIINILCFVKQGFNDPVTVSLFGLAISDLGSLATLTWAMICLTPGFLFADLPFIPAEVMYLTAGIPHTTFTRVTSWITAFITLERCLCITAPLQVNAIFTPKRVGITVGIIFIALIVSIGPVYVVNKLGSKFIPYKNSSLVGLVFTKDREAVEKCSFLVNNVFIPFAAFFIIVTCTLILVVQLRRKTKWRQEATQSEQASKVSRRNQKVAKMVVVISVLFIVCFIPVCVTFLAMTLEPKLAVDGKYKNLLTLMGGGGTVLESINSSVNIFIYYYMSSKYRDVLRKMFGFID